MEEPHLLVGESQITAASGQILAVFQIISRSIWTHSGRDANETAFPKQTGE